MIRLILTLAVLTFIPVMWALYIALGQLACWLCFEICTVAVSLLVAAGNVLLIFPEQLVAGYLSKSLEWQLPAWNWFAFPDFLSYREPHGWVLTVGVLIYGSLVLMAYGKYRDDNDFGYKPDRW